MTGRNRARIVLRLWLAVVMIGLALPLVSMTLLSFNSSRYGTLPFHFTTRWYGVLGRDDSLISAVGTSLRLSAQVTGICVAVGTLLSFGLVRAHITVRVPTNALLLTILTVPALILSAGMLEVFSWLGLAQSPLALVAASVATSLPFVVLVVVGRLQSLDPRYGEAARSLGAGPLRTFIEITTPLIAPAVVAGGLLAFVVCFNNFAVQLLIAPIGVSTLPVQIYSMERLGVTPDVDALGALIVAASILLVVVLNLFSGNAARLLASTRVEGTD